MTLEQCQREIKDRYYLIGSILDHVSGTHRIKIISLVTSDHMGINFIQCNYVKELSGTFDGTVLYEKLNAILSQYVFY